MNKIIAHRGAAAYAPENTMASFQKAKNLGASCVEFDVMLSADGEPFIFHDENLKRTTNGRGEFGQMNAEYLQSLDAGSWFSKSYKNEKIPHLKTVLEWLISASMDANIEIKPYPGQAEQTSTVVLSYLNRFWPMDKKLPLISSFDREVLTLCRSLSPEMPLGFLMHEWQDDWLKEAQTLQCYSVHLNRQITTPSRVQAIKDQGFLVFVYTVNRSRLARKLFSYGVDAIFSDYPDLLGITNG